MKIILPIMGVSLTCTIIIEFILALILGLRDKKDLFNVILVNIVTNPIVVSVSFTSNLLYGIQGKIISTIILEILAFLCEGFIYFKVLKYKKINGFLLSLILNVTSYTLGIFLNNIIWG